jgi:hypothetical protein
MDKMKPGRVSASRLIVWREALKELRKQAKAVVAAASVIGIGVAIINLYPSTPRWQSGFVTGFLVAFLMAFAWWVAFVPSGLALRSMGTLAEQWTSEALRKSDGVCAVIPSLKFDGRDIDHVVVSGAGILAVETKWKLSRPDAAELAMFADQAAGVCRTLRLSLRRENLPESLFRAAVVVWGAGARGLTRRVVETGRGPVTVMAGDDMDEWLASLRVGPVGRDYAEELERELHDVATERDRTIKAGPVLRWLARAR